MIVPVRDPELKSAAKNAPRLLCPGKARQQQKNHRRLARGGFLNCGHCKKGISLDYLLKYLPLAGLATTYSPTPYDAVPSALEPFTTEFGMGSGGGAPL